MPLVDLFLTVMWFFLFVAWVWLVFWVVLDIFRSHDLSGWAKASWALLVAIIPWLGVLIYLIARGKPMAESARHWASGDQAAHRYRQRAATGENASARDELAKLAKLRDAGVITEDEFNVERSKAQAKQ